MSALDDPGLAGSSGHPALSVQNVSIQFGSVKALSDVSLQVPDGGVIGVIGPNGAGKSTLMAVIGGQASPASGRVEFDGRDITGLGATARAQLGLRRTFQSLELFDDMTVRENILVGARTSMRRLRGTRQRVGSRPADEVATLMDEMDLTRYQYVRVQSLAAPIRRIVSYCRAIAGRPRCILLDEPAAGLSEYERQSLADRIRSDATKRGHSLIVVEHDMGFVRNLCDSIYVLDAGETIAMGAFDEVAADPLVRKAYLGE
jgi:ABC-type branched-subunit amino acid transport system ATPase component